MSRAQVVEAVSAQNVRANVEKIVRGIPHRAAGSENGRRMAEYSRDAMRAIGVDEVATMGEADEESLVAALRSPAPYVALVASPKRAAKVREFLAEEGLAADRLSKLHAPAGLDLGGPTAEEIALSVMAEIVQVRAGAPSLARVAPLAEIPTRAPLPEEAVDPVCGMTVAVAGARFTVEHAGQRFYFCCPGCRRSFEKQPERYLTRTA